MHLDNRWLWNACDLALNFLLLWRVAFRWRTKEICQNAWTPQVPWKWGRKGTPGWLKLSTRMQHFLSHSCINQLPIYPSLDIPSIFAAFGSQICRFLTNCTIPSLLVHVSFYLSLAVPLATGVSLTATCDEVAELPSWLFFFSWIRARPWTKAPNINDTGILGFKSCGNHNRSLWYVVIHQLFLVPRQRLDTKWMSSLSQRGPRALLLEPDRRGSMVTVTGLLRQLLDQ